MATNAKACNGIIKGGAKSCPQKQNCHRFALHQQNNEGQKHIEVPFTAVANKSCSFHKEMEE